LPCIFALLSSRVLKFQEKKMGRPKRDILATVEESATPPGELTPSQSLARVVKAEGNNVYTCELPNKKTALLELQSRFQNTVWIKRGGYVLIDVASAGDRGNSRVAGEIINVVRDERAWRKQPYWYENNSFGRGGS